VPGPPRRLPPRRLPPGRLPPGSRPGSEDQQDPDSPGWQTGSGWSAERL